MAGSYFGNRYFGRRYFGTRYWSPAAAAFEVRWWQRTTDDRAASQVARPALALVAAAGLVWCPQPVEAVANTVTPDKWLIRWNSPPRITPPISGSQPFVPKEAVLENTVTPDKWWRRFDVAVPRPPVWHTTPFYGYPYLSAENTQTPDKWLMRWYGPPRYQVTPAPSLIQPLEPPPEPVVNVAFDVGFAQVFKRTLQYQSSPFVPRAAVLENTVTPDKWMRPLGTIPPRTTPIHTTPFYGYPYEGVDNTRNEWDWYISFDAPYPRPPVRHTTPFYGYPYEQPDNTQTPDKWLRAFTPPVPRPPVTHSNPFFGFPYAFIDNTVTPEKWMQRWRGPARSIPRKLAAQPFVPDRVVIQNTIDGMGWHMSFVLPAKAPLPWSNQAQYGYPQSVVFEIPVRRVFSDVYYY